MKLITKPNWRLLTGQWALYHGWYKAWEAVSLWPAVQSICYCVMVKYRLNHVGKGKRTAGLWFFRLTSWTIRYWPELQADTKTTWTLLSEQCWLQEEAVGEAQWNSVSFWNPASSSAGFLPFTHSMGKILNYNQEWVMKANEDSYLHPPWSLICIHTI